MYIKKLIYKKKNPTINIQLNGNIMKIYPLRSEIKWVPCTVNFSECCKRVLADALRK